MTPDAAVDIGREAILTMLKISAPILITGMAVGLLIGLLQALTQIQEQTISFVPKVVAMVLALSFTLPWLINEMVRYSQDLIGNIPSNL